MMNISVFSPRSSMPTAGKSPCIVCCAPAEQNWRWLLEDLDEKPRQWHFCHDQPQGWLEKVMRVPNLAAMRAGWQAIQLVKRNQADLLTTGSASLTFWCAVFAALQNVKVYHVALSFYLPKLPNDISYLFAQWAYSTVNRFVVHSRSERQLYAEYFGIPAMRFEMHHWGGMLSRARSRERIERGEYICAIHHQAQDKHTLMTAIATLPHIPLVLILPKGRTIATKIPPNVTVRRGLSFAQQVNVIQHARFLVAPTLPSRLPSHHTTLVTAMQMSKTFITTDLPNVSDYAFHNSNAILCPPTQPEALAIAIQDLWNNVVRCEILGSNGKQFAEAFCSEDATRHYFRQLLIRRGL